MNFSKRTVLDKEHEILDNLNLRAKTCDRSRKSRLSFDLDGDFGASNKELPPKTSFSVSEEYERSLNNNEQNMVFDDIDKASLSFDDHMEECDHFEYQEVLDEKQRLYEGARFTSFEAALLVFSFMIRFNLSTLCRKQLLEIICVLLPIGNQMPKTINMLMTVLNFSQVSVEEKKFCQLCNSLLKEEICINEDCTCFSSTNTDSNSFFFVDPELQLKNILSCNIDDILSYRAEDRPFVDIIDSNFYKQHQESNQVCLSVYADGISLDNSSSYQFWPVFISIVDLPFKVRNSKFSYAICGIWFGKQKPSSEQLFGQITDAVQDRMKSHLEFQSKRTGATYRLKFYGLLMDTPAKSMALNMVGHSGYFCCPYCRVKGEYCKVLKKVIYPLEEHLPRDSDSFLAYASEAILKNQTIYGIKGPSLVHQIFTLPQAVPLDYMHLLCLGLFRRIMFKWFDSCNHAEKFYLGSPTIRKEVQLNLSKFRLPHSINRADFDLDHLAKWKANQFKNFFFYLALPCLKNILPSTFFWNLACLVFAIKYLYFCQNERHVHIAEEMLRIFCQDFPLLYGKDNLTFTMHCISSHLIQDVKNHGALVGHSMFGIEGLFGSLKASLNGTRGFSKQFLINFASRIHLINILNEAALGKDLKEPIQIAMSMLDLHPKTKTSHYGKFLTRSPTLFEKEWLKIDVFDDPELVISWKLKSDGIIYHSISTEKDFILRSSSCICFSLNDDFCFGFIDYFVEFKSHFFVCVNILEKRRTNLFSDIKGNVKNQIQMLRTDGFFDNFFYVVQKTNSQCIISLSKVHYKCIFFILSPDSYILSQFIYESEHD